MSSHQITPDETHVIKAMAWDSLKNSINLNPEQRKVMGWLGDLMDSILERVGDKVSKSSTWELGMAKKFKNDDYYKCIACGTATPKGDWLSFPLANAPIEFSKCPHCGGIFDLSIGNEIEPVEEPTQEPDAPEPEPKPVAKKPAAKK